jgi:hypothetical protein
LRWLGVQVEVEHVLVLIVCIQVTQTSKQEEVKIEKMQKR